MASNMQVKDCMLCRDEMVESTDKAILALVQEATQYFHPVDLYLIQDDNDVS
ncbi:AGAP000867-PA [Anopheles gambiae str. PEST]|uniref:AGAP000867-PA n=1 Tax=Anopheles gambiae TaxID=7165 RepID=A0NEZ4_ANOGA|nr:AGAP000867-PA [Anopheles gambiae str. PEST]